MTGVDLTYRNLDRCDRCGRPLEDRDWISGVCSPCAEAEKEHPTHRGAEATEGAMKADGLSVVLFHGGTWKLCRTTAVPLASGTRTDGPKSETVEAGLIVMVPKGVH